ncbi:Conjugative transfer protein TrbL [Candidatus Burkholderia verschuerenii]|uniref:Conjugative transfer protein TrbL n=1 Tax=Candidatus Burkholderia verschuerenii TaxID=242163 RepID=A0A0L0MJF1_9BURK|nr:hypothetical protein [Candidatus Burkholderia verschuerenii]KND62445.1 Conjugative transfer protein TrbL [Candidatus Burkholderia verschuerenii]
MKQRSIAVALAISLVSAVYSAQSIGGASEQVSVGTVSILAAPLASIVASGQGVNPSEAASVAGMGSVLVVKGVTEAGKDAVEFIADAASGVSKVSVKAGRSTAQAVGLSVGTTVNVVAQSTGTALVASGKLLAFIPNAAGEALLHHSRVPGTSPTTQQEAQQ